MKYLSIDIETTGLNPDRHQILSFGAIVEDTEKQLDFEEIPKFYKIIKSTIERGADPYALAMNSEVLKQIAKGDENCISLSEFKKELSEFIKDNFDSTITLAGKNSASFDLKFLEKNKWRDSPAPYLKFYGYNFKYHHRIIDPSSLYMDWTKDEVLPNLKTCKERAGVEGEVTHNALQDAWDVIQVLRKKY